MTPTIVNPVKAVTLVALGLAIAAMGIYVASADDAPGAAAMGLLVMAAGLVLGRKAARNRLSIWAGRTALVFGFVVAACAALLTHAVVSASPLFPQPDEVPSVVGSAPSPRYASAVMRAREIVRRAVLEQNLPGVSVAVGAGGTVVWAEGFGWRDVGTRTPVTPATRFVLGTAAPAIIPNVERLGLTGTGADGATAWSPEAIGEEGEDFPPLAILRHVVFQPLGLMAPDYPLSGDRATFYVPRTDDHDPRRGRRLMYMRDLARCQNGKTCYSTPSDLVRVAQATKLASIDGELAGGLVLSVIHRADIDLVVAVTSNIAHADTTTLAGRIAAAFDQ